MYRKILSILLCLICLFSLCACNDSNTPSESTNSTQEISKPTENTKEISGKTTIDNITVSLISLETNKFDNMYFEGFTKSTLTPSDDGTAMTLLIHSINNDINLNQIESVTIKSSKGSAVNMSTKTYLLNNGGACLVFAKTEGIHKATEYAVNVKTYDGEDKLLVIPEKTTLDKVRDFCTSPGDAKYGDMILIKNEPYFILQSGSLSSATYSSDDKNYSEVIIGTILIPLNNTFKSSLVSSDFSTKFYDIENYGNYNVKTEYKLNDEKMKTDFKNSFSGMYADLITCSFTIEVDKSTSQDQITARRDYVMNNTWIKGNFEENFLYKIYSLEN